jgi:hypothetical protein
LALIRPLASVSRTIGTSGASADALRRAAHSGRGHRAGPRSSNRLRDFRGCGKASRLGKRIRYHIGEGLANAFKLGVGDSVNLVLSTREGAMSTLDFKIVGIFRSLSKEYDARQSEFRSRRRRN